GTPGCKPRCSSPTRSRKPSSSPIASSCSAAAPVVSSTSSTSTCPALATSTTKTAKGSTHASPSCAECCAPACPPSRPDARRLLGGLRDRLGGRRPCPPHADLPRTQAVPAAGRHPTWRRHAPLHHHQGGGPRVRARQR